VDKSRYFIGENGDLRISRVYFVSIPHLNCSNSAALVEFHILNLSR
jgi:hypothetical protein